MLVCSVQALSTVLDVLCGITTKEEDEAVRESLAEAGQYSALVTTQEGRNGASMGAIHPAAPPARTPDTSILHKYAKARGEAQAWFMIQFCPQPHFRASLPSQCCAWRV